MDWRTTLVLPTYFNLAFGFIDWFSIFLILIQKPQTKLNHWTGFRLQSLIKSKFIKRSHSKLMDLIEMQWIIYAKRAHIVCAQYRKIGMFHIIRSLILMLTWYYYCTQLKPHLMSFVFWIIAILFRLGVFYWNMYWKLRLFEAEMLSNEKNTQQQQILSW